PAEGRAVALRRQERPPALVGRHRPGRPRRRAGALLEGADRVGRAEGRPGAGGRVPRRAASADRQRGHHLDADGARGRRHHGPAAGGPVVSPEEAMERLNVVMAHAWMVRNFLKHADEVQDDPEMLEVHRMIFDFIRAAEPSYQRKDAKEYLHRVRGKLPKLRRVAEYFAAA